MAFHFSLAAVLRYRQSLEERERLHLQRLHARRLELLRELEQIREHTAQLQRAMRQQLQQAPTPAIEVQFCSATVSAFARRQQQLQAALLQLQHQLALQTQRYKVERQKREVMESLRDLQLGEYRRQQQRREQAAIDELYLLRRNYKRA